MIFRAYREEFLGRLGGIRIDERAPAAIHLAREAIEGELEIVGPRALPCTRQRRRAVEDAIERLYLLLKIRRGIDQADAGETVTQEEARKRMAQWLP